MDIEIGTLYEVAQSLEKRRIMLDENDVLALVLSLTEEQIGALVKLPTDRIVAVHKGRLIEVTNDGESVRIAEYPTSVRSIVVEFNGKWLDSETSRVQFNGRMMNEHPGPKLIATFDPGLGVAPLEVPLHDAFKPLIEALRAAVA